jgi:PKD repeat protein
MYDLIPEPAADFTAEPRSGFAPLTTIFTDTSVGLIDSWAWHFGDGNTITLQNPSHTYTSTGVYTVSLSVSGSGGADTLTRTNYITVTEAPPTADFTGDPLSGTIPLTVTFSDASSGAINTYLWDFGDGITGTAQNPSHAYTAAGVYTVSLTVSGPGGADTLTRVDYITVNEPPPVADFSGSPLSGTAPLTVVFTDTSSGLISAYLWDFGDGITDTVQNPSHTYTAAGVYTVTLTVTGPGGSDTLTRADYITVNEPPPTADFSGAPLSGAAPLIVDFIDASTGTITTRLWDFGDGITSTLQNPSHTYADPGLYTVSLAVTGPGGTDTLTRVDYVTVNEPPPTADFFAAPLTGIAPLTVTFTSTSTGAITDYLWDFGDGITSTLQNPSHTYANAGLYTVNLTVTGPGGADTRARADYITVSEPPPTADFSGAPLSGTVPLTVTFTDASTGAITSYLWDFGDGITSTLQNPSHTYANAGLYTVNLTVTGPGGADTRTRVDYITVSEPPPIADFTGAPLSGTIPLTVTFTDASTGAITSYLWDFGDGVTSTLQSPVHTYTATGLYTVSLTVAGPSGADTLTREEYIAVADAPPTADFTGSPLTGTVPFTVTFTDASTGVITDYLWNFGDGITSTAQHPAHFYTSAGLYSVSLAVSGPGGTDILTRTDYITVNPKPPSPDFVGTPRMGNVPLTVTFTDLTDQDIFSRLWHFGDGITSTLQNPAHTYTATGVYTVSLTATGPGGSNTLTRPHYITVTVPPPVADFQAEPTTGAPPLDVNFTDLSTGLIDTYLWDFGDGTSSTSANPTHAYTATGIYTVSLTVMGPGGTNVRIRPEYIAVVDEPTLGDVIYVSSDTGGMVDGLAFADEDILAFDTGSGSWSLYFDGSDVGLGPVDVDAFTLLDDGTILLSLDEPFDLNNNGREVDDSAILRFTPTSLGDDTDGSFALYFNGATVGLTTNAEDIDAIGVTAEGHLIVSTLGAFNVGTVSGADEDLLLFKPESLGSNTSGEWELYFDGSDVGLANTADEDVWGTWLDTQTQDIYLTTRGVFAVPGLSGDGADIFVCSPSSTGSNTQCTFESPIFWDGSAHGFAGQRVDGFAIALTSTAPTADFEASPTEGALPLTVNFTDLSTGDVTSWAWDFGDGNTSTSQHPTHTYMTSGNYTVSLTVAGPGGSDTHIRTGYITVVEPEVSDTIYVSSDTGGTIEGLAFADEDILAFDTGSGSWSLYFDGSDVGLGPVDVDAFTLLDDGSILLSLDEPFDVNNNGREVDDSAILRFTPTSLGDDTDGSFALYFNGATVGLTTDAEDIDAIGVTAEGHLIISTLGAFNVGTVSGADEDLLLFKPESLGSNTSGEWELYFDGSDVGLGDSDSEDVWGVWLDRQTQNLYLTTQDAFAVPGLSGDGADVFICTLVSIGSNTECPFDSALFWDGSAHGFSGQRLDGLAVTLEATAPLADFTAAPTTGAVPLIVDFTDASLGQIESYLWDFGDGSMSSQPSPTYVYITPETYTVSLTVSGPDGQHTRVQSNLITVNPAAACATQCLRVSDIQFGTNGFGQLQGLVTIVDENGVPVPDVTVSIIWTLPEGETLALSANTGPEDNVAIFILEETPTGLHVLTVVDVTKSGQSFDPANSVLRNSTLQEGTGRFNNRVEHRPI